MYRTVVWTFVFSLFMPIAILAQERVQGAYTAPARNALELAGWISTADDSIYVDLTVYREAVKEVCGEVCEVGDDALDFSVFITGLRSTQRACPAYMVLVAPPPADTIVRSRREGEECLFYGERAILTLLTGNPVLGVAKSQAELVALTVDPMASRDTFNIFFADSVLLNGKVLKDSASIGLGPDELLRVVRRLPSFKQDTSYEVVIVTDTIRNEYREPVGKSKRSPWFERVGWALAGAAVTILANEVFFSSDCECEEKPGGPVNQPNTVVPVSLQDKYIRGVPALARRQRGVGVRIPLPF